jgi:hypothetical protein
MKNKKITPLEALDIKRVHLEVKSEALVDSLEKQFDYLQDNAGSLIGETIVDGITSKLPPFLRNLINRYEDKKEEKEFEYDFNDMNFQENSGQSQALSYLDKALDMVPFFVKGFKGMALSFVLRKALNAFMKK